MVSWISFAFILSFLLSFFIGKKGKAWGLVDMPTERSSHSSPIPKGGGIGIFIVFIAGSLWWKMPWLVLSMAFMVSAVSLVGDFKDVSYKIRLAVQLFSAAALTSFIYFGLPFSELPMLTSALLFLFGTLFITVTANYYNFMDGINGIAGITGTIAFSGLGLYGIANDKEMIWIVVAFGIAAACLGFLPQNFPRAKVFMGDVGSVLLGFLFATWVLWFSESLLEFLVLVSFLFPFYADGFYTSLVRIKKGDSLVKPHRRHIYQILVNQAGRSHSSVTLLYGFIQIILAVLAWLTMKVGLVFLISLLLILFGLFVFIGDSIRQRWET